VLFRDNIATGKIFLTGQPGSGKSTVFIKSIKLLQEMGCKVGGIHTPEIRRKGKRIGFNVVDIASKRTEVLASVNIKPVHRVGKYGVNLPGFESVAIQAIDYAENNCDIICIDEIGRMELLSKQFKYKLESVLKGPKPLLAVLHRNYVSKYGFIGKLHYVSYNNRDQLPQKVLLSLERLLNKKNSSF
jgi:nucleoside-triphosphatase